MASPTFPPGDDVDHALGNLSAPNTNLGAKQRDGWFSFDGLSYQQFPPPARARISHHDEDGKFHGTDLSGRPERFVIGSLSNNAPSRQDE